MQRCCRGLRCPARLTGKPRRFCEAGGCSERRVCTPLESPALHFFMWLRRNGVNTHGAAANINMCDRLGKKVRPGTFGKIQVGQWEYPKSPSLKKHEICSDPISADPICPFSDPCACHPRARAAATFSVSTQSKRTSHESANIYW